MVPKETTIQQSPNEVDVNNYRSPYGLYQTGALSISY